MPKFNFYWIYAIIGVFLIGNILFSYGPNNPSVNPIELESMVENNYPTTGEVNDIYTTLEMSTKGLVLAAETAIGKYPIECVQYFNEFIKFCFEILNISLFI